MDLFIIGFAVVSLGITLLAAGIYFIARHRRIQSHGRKTSATVVELQENNTRDGITYTQIIEFKNNQGETIKQPWGFSSSVKPKQRIPYRMPIYVLKKGDTYEVIPSQNSLLLTIAYSFALVGFGLLLIFILHIFEVINFL